MRTGMRCTTLVKLPVAFSGGSSENTAPEAGASDDTVPSKSWPSVASTETRTFSPGTSLASCVSLKLATM